MAISVTEKIGKLSERYIAGIWQRGMLCGRQLMTEDGKRVEVIYPGRQNDGRGADFRDAVITTDDGKLKGDVEIHVRSSGWKEHGHNNNTAYNSVVLHVVMLDNAGRPTILQDGNTVPVISLERYADILIKNKPGGGPDRGDMNLPCRECLRRQSKDTVLEFIERSGEKRFIEKVTTLEKDIVEAGAGEVLYREIMGALGYSRNKDPFMELARRLPLRVLESPTVDRISDEDYLNYCQALLLGTSGLVSGCNRIKYSDCIPSGIRIKKTGGIHTINPCSEPMSADDWCLFKVRPNNSPVRRLIAMSYLLVRYREKGLLGGLLGLVEEILENGGCRELEKGLQVDFLGGGRAADITVNVLLPISLAWSRQMASPGLGKSVIGLFLRYPKTATNSVEKHLSGQLGLDKSIVNTAAKQQGLIHIYKTLCTQGKCRECRLGDFEVGDHIQIQAIRTLIPEAEVSAGGNHGSVVGAEFKRRDKYRQG